MINNIYILLFTNIVCFCLGYFWCKLSSGDIHNNINDMVSVKSKKLTRNKSEIEETENIEIDDTKYVGKIDTDNLEKKYKSLGQVKTTEDDTISSINKLKNLKGK